MYAINGFSPYYRCALTPAPVEFVACMFGDLRLGLGVSGLVFVAFSVFAYAAADFVYSEAFYLL
jgi:hypothetical protein